MDADISLLVDGEEIGPPVVHLESRFVLRHPGFLYRYKEVLQEGLVGKIFVILIGEEEDG